MIIYVPFFSKIFSITHLDFNDWLLVIYFSVPVILIDEVSYFILDFKNHI